MKNLFLIGILALNFNAFASDKGNGGDDLGLKFLSSFSTALSNIKRESPDIYSRIYSYDLEGISNKIKVIIVDEALDVRYKDIVQTSVASNIRTEKTIYVNRKRWKDITDEGLKEAIALHEVLSLYGMEQSGFYPISSKYLEMKNLLESDLKSNLQIDRFKQLKVENPKASPFEILQLFFNEAKSAPALSDFDDIENNSNQVCQISSNDTPTIVSVGTTLKRAAIEIAPAVMERGPLFPGTPAVTENRIVYGLYSLFNTTSSNEILKQYPNTQNIELINWSESKLNYSDKELTQIAEGMLTYSQIQVHDVLVIRKNNGLISFKFESSSKPSLGNNNKGSIRTGYGYCYPTYLR